MFEKKVGIKLTFIPNLQIMQQNILLLKLFSKNTLIFKIGFQQNQVTGEARH